MVVVVVEGLGLGDREASFDLLSPGLSVVLLNSSNSSRTMKPPPLQPQLPPRL